MALKGIQSHIESWTDPLDLQFLIEHNFQAGRIAAMDCDVDTMRGMLDETQKIGLVPYVTIQHTDRMEYLSGLDAEWRNEDDGDISPAEYRKGLDEACRAAVEHGVRLWGPTISNLDRDSLKWLEQVRGAGWPEGLYGISAHRYGNGTFEHPHFLGVDWLPWERESEVRRLKASCDGKPFCISEFGYPTFEGLTEDEQKYRISQEYQFWDIHGAWATFLFQMNDGPNADYREHRYGIRRCDEHGNKQGWKPSAYVLMA